MGMDGTVICNIPGESERRPNIVFMEAALGLLQFHLRDLTTTSILRDRELK